MQLLLDLFLIGSGSDVGTQDIFRLPDQLLLPILDLIRRDVKISPHLLTIVPLDGAQDIGVNASIALQFDEAINPLTVNEGTVQITDGNQTSIFCTIMFSSNNQLVTLLPHAPLPDGSVITVTLDGLQDVAGNPVAMESTQFTTRIGPKF